MFRSSLVVLLTAIGVANAHYRLLAPLPRGAHDSAQQVNFCGGHTDVTTNRTLFPLEGGSFTIRQGHPDWTIGVLISTDENPNTFDKFNANGEPQLVRGYVTEEKAGTFCFDLNIGAANIPGVGEGSNVTIQFVVDGGDGQLYQCADLTLSESAPKTFGTSSCTNETATSTSDHSSPTASHGPDDGHNHGSDDDTTGAGFKQDASLVLTGAATLAGLFAVLL